MQNKTFMTVAGNSFPTKKAVATHVRAVVERYLDHVDLAEEDFSFLQELLTHHPWAAQKMGAGVKRIWIADSGRKNRCFFLERVDGSRTDFSWLQCLSPKDYRLDFHKACRAVIEPVMNTFRLNFLRNNPRAVCEVLKVPLNLGNSHCDHKAPNTFLVLVEDFLREGNLVLNEDLFLLHQDGMIGCCFASASLAAGWLAYHNQRSVLRVISATANLRLGQKMSLSA